jgi:hypothetical protein
MARELEAAAMTRCGWCGRDVGNREVVGFGARANPGLDLSPFRGSVIEVDLPRAGRRVPAFVVGPNSPAARRGHDLYFMACGDACAGALREALRAEMAPPSPQSPP